jgi:hypothetical protein
MNITFWLMETLLKINASIFGENGALSRLTQLTVKGLHFVHETSPAEIGAALGDCVQASADADFINQLLGDQSHGKTEE